MNTRIFAMLGIPLQCAMLAVLLSACAARPVASDVPAGLKAIPVTTPSRDMPRDGVPALRQELSMPRTEPLTSSKTGSEPSIEHDMPTGRVLLIPAQ